MGAKKKTPPQRKDWSSSAHGELASDPVAYPEGRSVQGADMTAPKSKRWSQQVTQKSDALDLEHGVFTKGDPKAIARSLKRSAEQSHRRKADPFRSAMSMLTFYVNRAGKTLSKQDRSRLEAAKDELRELFARPRAGR